MHAVICIIACHMRRRIHACHMRRRIHACRNRYYCCCYYYGCVYIHAHAHAHAQRYTHTHTHKHTHTFTHIHTHIRIDVVDLDCQGCERWLFTVPRTSPPGDSLSPALHEALLEMWRKTKILIVGVQ
jgi:hypothetical protein